MQHKIPEFIPTKDLEENINFQSNIYRPTSIFNPINMLSEGTFSTPTEETTQHNTSRYNPIKIKDIPFTQKTIDKSLTDKNTTKNQTITTGNTSSSYKKNRNIIYDYLKDNLGLNKEQAAGVLGVLYSESGLNPNIIRKGGTDTGLAQWVGSRKTKFKNLFAKELKDSTIQEQLEFIKWELNNSHQILPKLKNAKTPEEAAEVWFAGYENGGGGNLVTREQVQASYGKHYPGNNNIYDWMLKTRINNTRKIYNELS